MKYRLDDYDLILATAEIMECFYSKYCEYLIKVCPEVKQA